MSPGFDHKMGVASFLDSARDSLLVLAINGRGINKHRRVNIADVHRSLSLWRSDVPMVKLRFSRFELW